MPIYEFVCRGCGPFEQWRHHRQSGQAVACPSCDAVARRSYGPPLVGSPGHPFSSASRDVRARVERSVTGEPIVAEAVPRGREVTDVLHASRHTHDRHPTARPWQVNH